MFECVINIAEGRDHVVLEDLRARSGVSCRDLHVDPVHHRSVFTLINEPERLTSDVHSLLSGAFATLSLEHHLGVHPRLGVVDVVPFVALDPSRRREARAMRDQCAAWISSTFHVATFLYGTLNDATTRTLPEIRRHAFVDLAPDFGPSEASPRFGAVAVGERPILVAWNIWLRDCNLERARFFASRVRSDSVRALGFDLGGEVQVSCNLLDVRVTPPSRVYDDVLALVQGDERITRCELVGLAPASLLEREPKERWEQLDLSTASTIEARLGD